MLGTRHGCIEDFTEVRAFNTSVEGEEDAQEKGHGVQERDSPIVLSDLDRRLAVPRADGDPRFYEINALIPFPDSVYPLPSGPDLVDLPLFTGERPELHHDLLPLLLGHRLVDDSRLVDDEGTTK